jgi:hypothetical protein
MIRERLPDGRPPRRDPGIASAAWHPELAVGEFALPPRALPEARIPPLRARWSAAGLALALVAVLALPILALGATGLSEPGPRERAHAATCAAWDAAATEAIGRRPQRAGDGDLRQADAIRLRRARRACDTGWINLACLDYQHIIGVARERAGGPLCRLVSRFRSSPHLSDASDASFGIEGH